MKTLNAQDIVTVTDLVYCGQWQDAVEFVQTQYKCPTLDAIIAIDNVNENLARFCVWQMPESG